MEDWEFEMRNLKKEFLEICISETAFGKIIGKRQQSVNRFFSCKIPPSLKTYLLYKKEINNLKQLKDGTKQEGA